MRSLTVDHARFGRVRSGGVLASRRGCGAGKKSSGSSSSGSGQHRRQAMDDRHHRQGVALDPPAPTTNGSLMLETQVYQYLMTIRPAARRRSPTRPSRAVHQAHE